uniref:Uncharacterized protein n=1 Tax=Romanomermis culicivorax TaxID=13658 RepID=A0A915L6R8_ROMCU
MTNVSWSGRFGWYGYLNLAKDGVGSKFLCTFQLSFLLEQQLKSYRAAIWSLLPETSFWFWVVKIKSNFSSPSTIIVKNYTISTMSTILFPVVHFEDCSTCIR